MVLFCLTLPLLPLKQTAQRKIREIIQQVKQQEQKHQQGAAVSPQHSKWPAGRLQQAPANECSPPRTDRDLPRKRPKPGGTCRADQQHQYKPKNFILGENMWEPKAEGVLFVCTVSPVRGDRVGDAALVS